MVTPASWSWLTLIERHRQRRAQGIPTVTVLAGDRRVGGWLWRSMPATAGHAWLVAHGSDPQLLVAQWFGGSETAVAIRASILALIANDAGTSTAELIGRLRGHSDWQLELLAERTSATHDLALAMVRTAVGLAPDSGDPKATPHALRQVARLLGRVPPILVDPESTSIDSLCRAAVTAAEFAQALPHADVGLLVGDAVFDALSAGVPDRVAAMLKEGLVALRARNSAPQPSAHAGVPAEYDAEAFARSRAEQKLFETLNRRSRTAGMFKLNQKLAHDESDTPLEIDLLAESLELAVEVDGYHHFRDAHGYRRDRRKDVQLQHLGYVVVRVLASDVDSELEHVLEIIDAAVERRRRRAP